MAAAPKKPLVEHPVLQNIRTETTLERICTDYNNSMFNVQIKQCIHCEELFVNESSLVIHLNSKHGVNLSTEEPHASETYASGKFVRAPKKRKIAADDKTISKHYLQSLSIPFFFLIFVRLFIIFDSFHFKKYLRYSSECAACLAPYDSRESKTSDRVCRLCVLDFAANVFSES